MPKQDIWEHRRWHIDIKRKEIRNKLCRVGDIWIEVWGIRNSCTENAFLVCMPSHVGVCGLCVGEHPQCRGDSILEGTEHAWGWHPEVTECKRPHTSLDPKRHKKGPLHSAIYTQSLAHSRNSINLCGTNEQPRVLSKVKLVCKNIWEQDTSSCSWPLLLFYNFLVVSLKGMTLPCNSCSHPFSVIPIMVSCSSFASNYWLVWHLSGHASDT